MNRHRLFIKIYWFILCLAPAVILGAGRYVHAADSGQSCFRTHWPSELSNLEHDPSLVRGVLANGFRYVFKKNEEPENRVAVYLYIAAGSLQENDDQRGLAHFLEHLMFNGSTHFPPGSLVDFFQSIGMSFGGDTNARTTYDETVYHLILPGGTEQDLDAGFLVMADFARGALLLDKEIDNERGVILAEKRARDSAGYRVNVAESAVAFRGTRYSSRLPIGDEQVLKNADRSLLRAYYDAWYRPENMTLVIVGDTDPQPVQSLVEKYFAKLSATGPNPTCPDFGALAGQGTETFYYHEPELGRTDVSVQSFWDIDPENDSRDLEKRELLQFIGTKIMGYRLEKLLETADLPFSKAQYYAGDIVNRIGYGSLAAQTAGSNWQETVTVLEKTLRQALQYGFRQDEIDRAKKEILADLDERVLTEKTQDSKWIGRRIIQHLNSNRVYQSPRQEKELYGSIIDQIDPDDVNRAFRKVWGHNRRLVSVTGDAQLGEKAGAAITAVFRRAQTDIVPPSADSAKKTFPYLQPSKVGRLLPEEITVADIGVKRLNYPNGLKVNLKQTAFDDKRFLLSANFGNGKQQENHPGMAMLAEEVINGSGSARLSRPEIEALVSGTSIDMSFRAGEASFSWSGSGLSRDFELFIQLLYTMLFDPGLRENVFARVRENYELMYQKIARDIEGADPLKIQPFLATYHDHFGLPAWKDVEAITFDDLSAWVKSSVRPTDLEISLVGDFNREDAVAIVGKYFAGASFADYRQLENSPVSFPAGKTLDVNVQTSLDKSLITVAWPTGDFWDIHRTRRLQLLAAVFSDRLRRIVREKLGASYSPNVSSYGSRVYKGYGFIKTQMVVEPGKENAVIAEIFNIGSALQKNGVSPDELLRAKEPILTALAGSLRSNTYWLYSVLSLSCRYPRQLTWPATVVNDYQSVSVQEVNALAAEYLRDNRAAVVKVSPEKDKITGGLKPAAANTLCETGNQLE